MKDIISISCVGDLILDEPGPMEPYFEGTREIIKNEDLMIGHVETPHTSRPEPSCIDIQAPPSNPDHLDILKDLGFKITSTAGNHSYDCGPNGVIDTLDKLESLGIKAIGTGRNIYEAKKAAFEEINGVKVGALSYNCTGPELGFATSQKPGTNYVRVQSAYAPVLDMPGASVKTYTFILKPVLEKFREEVKALKAQCDIAVLCIHKGYGGDVPRLLDYEQELCYAAIDAGADIIFAHHHHVLKAVEIYKGKPIYHGLGNFVCATYAMTAGYNDTPEMVAYLKQRGKEGRGDGHYPVPFYPWSDVSRYTMIAKVFAAKDGVVKSGFIPCYIEKNGNIVPKYKDNGGEEVLDFIKKQTSGAGCEVEFSWSEDGTYVEMKTR